MNFLSKSTDQRPEAAASCPRNPDVNKEQAEINIWFDVQMKRKRKFIDDMEYNDEAWNFAKDFDENWLTSISESQSGLIPLDLVKQSKQWFEYLPVNPSSKSRYRCKVCNKHAKKFKVKLDENLQVRI